MSNDLLTYQEAEEVLESILANATVQQVESRSGPRFVLFRHPNTQDTIYSRYMRQRALVEAQAAGLASKAELEQVILDKQILSVADEARIKELGDKIGAQRRLLQITKIEGRRQPILENISRFEQEIAQLRGKGRELIYMSAESKAEEEVILYLTYAGTYNMDFQRYWPTFQDFEDERDLYFRNCVIEAFNHFNRGLPTKTIRFLARHGIWRIRYSAALKVGGKLFQQEFSDLTPDQVSLIYWSGYYQAVYEMLPDERPDEDTIVDDDALDAHMELVAKRRDEDRNEGRVKRRGGNSKKAKLSAWDRGEELIVTAAHPEYMSMTYSDERIKATGDSPDVEVISPNSKRAKNRAQARRNRRGL